MRTFSGKILVQTNASGPTTSDNLVIGRLSTIASRVIQTGDIDLTAEIVKQIGNKSAFKANTNFIKAAEGIIGTALDIQG